MSGEQHEEKQMNVALVRRDYQRSPWMAGPFNVCVDGVTWRCGTDSRLLVAHRADGPEDAAAARVTRALLAGEPVRPTPIDMAALAAWCGPHENSGPCRRCDGSPPEKCDRCNGTGYVECVCSHCDDAHDAICEDCDEQGGGCRECGDTGRGDPPMRLGVLRDTVVDRNLLALGLLALGSPEGSAQVGLRPNCGGGSAGLEIRAKDWRLLIMPVSMGREGLERFDVR